VENQMPSPNDDSIENKDLGKENVVEKIVVDNLVQNNEDNKDEDI
jgi:hypothetical protein